MRFIVRQAIKFFKTHFWTIFFEKNFFWIFFSRIFWNFSRCIGFQRRGWYQTLPYEVGFQRFIVRQAIKFFKPTFERFSLIKVFFEFFSDVFLNFSRCIGFQSRGVVSNASLWSGLSAVYSPTSYKIFKPTFERFSLKKIFFWIFLDVFFEIFRDALVSRVGGWYQTLPYEVCFQSDYKPLKAHFIRKRLTPPPGSGNQYIARNSKIHLKKIQKKLLSKKIVQKWV